MSKSPLSHRASRVSVSKSGKPKEKSVQTILLHPNRSWNRDCKGVYPFAELFKGEEPLNNWQVSTKGKWKRLKWGLKEYKKGKRTVRLPF